MDSSYLQTVQKTMCKYTYTYTQYTQCIIKTYFSYQYTLYTVYTSALCTHLYIVICEGQQIKIYSRLVVQQIVVQVCNQIIICNVVDGFVWCPVIAEC